MNDTITVPDGERVTNLTADERLDIARERNAQLAREVKNKADTIEQLHISNATLASDALALMTAKEIVFGDDAQADNMQLFAKLREWQAKAATLDRLTDAMRGEVEIAIVISDRKLFRTSKAFVIEDPSCGDLFREYRQFASALDALLGEAQS